MKKVLCLLIVASFATVSQAAYVNLLDNPGFETGEVDPWFGRFGTPIEVTDDTPFGCAALRAYDRGVTYKGPVQDVTDKMVEGMTYMVSGWMKSDGTEATGQMTFETNLASPFKYIMAAEGAISGEWTRLEGTFTVPEGVTSVVFYVETKYGEPYTGDIYADDLAIYIPEPATITLLSLGGLALIRRRKS